MAVARTGGNQENQSKVGLGPAECGDRELMELLEEEVRPAKGMISPAAPTQDEIDHHNITHLPYRSWCPACVEAFAREWAHKTRDEPRLIPLVSCDYLYISSRGLFARNELTEKRAGCLGTSTCHVVRAHQNRFC